jgi:hypothetical protein
MAAQHHDASLQDTVTYITVRTLTSHALHFCQRKLMLLLAGGVVELTVAQPTVEQPFNGLAAVARGLRAPALAAPVYIATQ